MSSVFSRLHMSSSQDRRPVQAWERAGRSAFVSGRLHDAEITADHAAALATWLGLGSVVVLGAWFRLGTGWALCWLAMLVGVPVAFVGFRTGRRPRRVLQLMPDTIDMIARSLRSGATLRSALTEVSIDAPQVICEELRPIVRAVERGQPLTVALREWAGRSPSPEIRIVAAALSFASVNEAGTLQGLEGVAHSLRDRAIVKAEIRSLTAQASVSMQALVLLPFGFLSIDAVGDRRVVRFLWRESIGQVCLAAGITMNVVGWLWMQRLIKARLPS